MVIAILSGLLIMGAVVFANYTTMRNNQYQLSYCQSGYIFLSHQLKELRKKEKIAAVLNDFTHKKLSVDVLWSLTELVYDNSKTFGYDPLLVLAVIHVESMFDPQALGKYRSGKYSGAFGLMQLKVETAKEVGARLGIAINSKEDLFVPEINIALGVAYLTKQISEFKSLKLGILAYNQGPGVILDNIKYRTPLSIRYYNKVLKSYFKLKKMENQ
jgi:soluble lytic murein transglycosylase-like protein